MSERPSKERLETIFRFYSLPASHESKDLDLIAEIKALREERDAAQARIAEAYWLLRGVQDDDADGVIALEPPRLEALKSFLVSCEKEASHE